MFSHGSLFSGIGGFDLGFERAGMHTIWQVEIGSFAQKILRKQFSDVPLHEDIRNCGAHNLERPNIISGGFPCQDLSTSQNGRKSGLAGERSGLFYEAARIIGELKPEWFVLENVAGLFSSDEGKDFDIVINTMAKLGYCVSWRTLDSQYFGVPQHRARVFIVGSFGCEDSVRVLFEGLPQSQPGSARETPPQTLESVAINPYQYGSNGVGISRVVHTLDSRPDRVVLAPFDRERVGEITGVPVRLDANRTRAVGNAVTVNVTRWLGERILAVANGGVNTRQVRRLPGVGVNTVE